MWQALLSIKLLSEWQSQPSTCPDSLLSEEWPLISVKTDVFCAGKEGTWLCNLLHRACIHERGVFVSTSWVLPISRQSRGEGLHFLQGECLSQQVIEPVVPSHLVWPYECSGFCCLWKHRHHLLKCLKLGNLSEKSFLFSPNAVAFRFSSGWSINMKHQIRSCMFSSPYSHDINNVIK